ncbi:MAG: universal stress protein [Candidatus Magnetomorum sp.]|nr:universal stress protein [Candidatus Magnetomorum sp.]
MKKVLLAIDGVTPTVKIFRYAVQLCQWTKAELNVLQIVGKRNTSNYLSKLRKKAGVVRQYFEDSMVAATYAEAGEHETARDMIDEAMINIKKILPESEKAGVKCHLVLKNGETEKEIINYVKEHRDVVFTIYDAPHHEQNDNGTLIDHKRMIKNMEQKLPIPLFVFNR